MSELSDADELVQRLRSFAAAYPEDLFPPLTKLERDALPRGTIDRISAAMGRHCSQIMAGAADRLETLERENAELKDLVNSIGNRIDDAYEDGWQDAVDDREKP